LNSMPLVVFMRGVNVGGHKAFKPNVLAKELANFDVVNVGAAGTFVVRGRVSQAALRAALLERLPFHPELMICRSGDIVDLAAADPFADQSTGPDVKKYVTVLAKRPSVIPDLPISRPASADWQVKLIATRDRFVLSLHRRLGRTLVYPNEVVEKVLGVSATTRNWNTINAIHDILKRG
jgi:uncharacterized protein (DUF1697 family)